MRDFLEATSNNTSHNNAKVWMLSGVNNRVYTATGQQKNHSVWDEEITP